MLESAKDAIDPKSHKGVYSILCSCSKVYIGETGRSFGVRLKAYQEKKNQGASSSKKDCGCVLCTQSSRFWAQSE